MLACWFKVTLGKSMICESNDIMHCYVLQTFTTMVIFNRVTSHEQCLSSHESKISFNQLVV